MMTQRTIATTVLCLTLLAGGITACNRASSTDADQSSNPSPTVAQTDASPTNAPDAQERMQRRQAMRQQIEAVLTPAQKQQLETQLQQGTKMRDAMASLNLTADQKAKIRDIMKNARAHRSEQQQPNSQSNSQ